MSYILGDAKPPLDEALLEHYGVKGMRWGVRRSQAQLDRAAGRKQKRVEKTTAIKDARARTASRERNLQRQVDKTNLAKPGVEQAREASKLRRMNLENLANPDRATALRMTNGEKAGLAAIALLPGAGTAIALGIGLGTVGQRKVAEKQQVKAKAAIERGEAELKNLLELEKKDKSGS